MSEKITCMVRNKLKWYPEALCYCVFLHFQYKKLSSLISKLFPEDFTFLDPASLSDPVQMLEASLSVSDSCFQAEVFFSASLTDPDPFLTLGSY